MNNLSIALYSPFVFENLIVNTQKFIGVGTTIDDDMGEAAILDTEYNNLQWEDFENASMICNYYDNIDSSRAGTGQINGYIVQRKKAGQKYWDTIFEGSVGAEGAFDPTAINYNVIDYNVQNNIQYLYRVIPEVSSKSSFVINQDVGTIPFITDWEVFTLTAINITGNPQNIYKGKAEPIYDSDGNPIIWTFVANYEEGSLTKVQDKTYFDTFAKYPKVSFGNTNYFTIPFSGLLGSIDKNINYYENTELWEKWNEFINSNYLCLYKNLKGDCRIVSINSESTNTYANPYANYYQDSNDYITSKPTTVSFNMTEVLDARQYTVADIPQN